MVAGVGGEENTVGPGIGQLQDLSFLWAELSQGSQDFQLVRPRMPPAFTAGLRKKEMLNRSHSVAVPYD